MIGDSNGLIMYQGRAITPEQYQQETGIATQTTQSGQVIVTQPPAPAPAPVSAPVSKPVPIAFTPGRLSAGGEIQEAVRQDDGSIYYLSYLGNGEFNQGSSRYMSESDRAALDAYVKAHPEQQFARRTADEQEEQANSMYVNVIRPNGKMVNLDYPSVNTPDGLADFKSKLAALPTGTAIMLNNNEYTAGMGYSYLGGIINDEGEFLQGFGAQTPGMRAVVDASGLSGYTLVDTTPAPEVKNYNSSSWLTSINNKGVPNSIARPSYISYPEKQASRELPEQVFDWIYGGYKPSGQGSVIVDINRAVTSSFMARSAEVEGISDNLGGLGGEVARGIGYIGLTPFLLGSAATGAARVGETAVTRGPGAAVGEMGGNIGTNIPAMIQGAGEHPIATGITLLPIGVGIAGAVKGGSAASLGKGVISTGSKARTSIEGIIDTTGKIDTKTVQTKTPFRNADYAPGGDLGPIAEQPTTKITGALNGGRVTDIDSFLRGENTANIRSYTDQQGTTFKVINNEKIGSYGLTREETTRLFNNPKFTATDKSGNKVIDLSNFGSREEILMALDENTPLTGAAISMSGKFSGGQVRGSLWRQLLEDDQGSMPRQQLITRQTPKSNTKVRVSFEDAFTKTASNSLGYLKTTGRLTKISRFNYPIMGTGLTALGLNSMLGSTQNNKAHITPKFDMGLFSGTGYKTYPIQGTGSKSKTTYRSFTGSSSKTKTQTDAAVAAMLGVGTMAALGLSTGRRSTFGKSLGSDYGSGFLRNVKPGMKRGRYNTGDVTSLIYGKKKKAKRSRR